MDDLRLAIESKAKDLIRKNGGEAHIELALLGSG